jgi:hypothetical protein
VSADADRPPLDETRQAMVLEALQDEYHGEALYGRVLEKLGDDARPFANVVHAEERHAALLEELLESRGLPVPESRWASVDLPTYGSRQEACSAAVEFELANVALYDRFLADDGLPEDVRRVFEHNRMASLEHHKPAFERCGGQGPGPRASGQRGQGRGGCGHHGCRGRGCGSCGHHGCRPCGNGGCRGSRGR